MLLENLLSLPVGAHVSGDIGALRALPGVVAELEDGSHLIRWDDGYSTIPLGKVREYDEYIASHTRIESTMRLRVITRPHYQFEEAEAATCCPAARVKRT